MNDEQRDTLRRILSEQGLSDGRIHDVMLLLRYKPDRVQLVFYYAVQGWIQEDIALTIGMSRGSVQHYINNSLADVRLYLREISQS
jgi:hypothetical protein